MTTDRFPNVTDEFKELYLSITVAIGTSAVYSLADCSCKTAHNLAIMIRFNFVGCIDLAGCRKK
jgi:hypothetical protein